MQNKSLNRRERFVLTWSPLLLALSLLGLILSLWYGPVFTRYLIACAVPGLLYGGFVIFDYRKKLAMLPALGTVIFIFGEKVARSAFIDDISDRDFKWRLAFQYFSIVLLSVFGWAWFFRQRILKGHGE